MTIKKKIKFWLFKVIARFNQSNLQNKNINMHEVKRILIIRQDNRIGNILFITSLIELVNKKTNICPDIIAGEKFHTLLKSNPRIGTILVFKQRQFIKHPRELFRFFRSLKGTKYDLVIDCKNTFSFNNALLTLFSNARLKIGFSNPLSKIYLNYSLDMTNDNSMHESVYLTQPFIQYFNLDCEIPLMSYSFVNSVEKIEFNTNSKIVGIHIGGRNEKSICPHLVNQICAELQNNNMEILIIYGPDELEKSKRIIDRKNMMKIFPDSMDQLAQIINSTDLFITPDTGPLHIASALDKSIIAVFNTGNGKRYGPRNHHYSSIIQTNELSNHNIVNAILSNSLEK